MPNQRAEGLIKVGAWMPDAALHAIDAAAAQQGVSRSEWLRRVISSAIETPVAEGADAA